MKPKHSRFFSSRAISNLIVIGLSILFYILLSNFTTVRKSIGWFFSAFSPFIIALVLAFLLDMPARFFERTIFRKLKNKRTFSIITSYISAVIVLTLLIGLIFPQIIDSISKLVSNIPSYLQNLNNMVAWLNTVLPFELEIFEIFDVSSAAIRDRLMEFLLVAGPGFIDFTKQLSSGIIGGFTAFIASIYILVSKKKLITQYKRVLYAFAKKKHADEILRVSKLSNNIFSGFISGKLLDSMIIGVLCYILMSLVGLMVPMPYTLLISVVIGITNIIPFFGPFIGAIPCVFILLLVNPWSALWFTVMVLLLQQFDGNILGPKILGNSTGLPALWVLIAIVVGGKFFGFTGMVLGVPTTAVLYTLASDITARHLKNKGLDSNGKPLPSREELSNDDNVLS